MNRPTLFLMLGYPGAGKTTVSHFIHDLTGAKHIWADHERHALYPQPTYTKAESDTMYEILNQRTEALLEAGKSVIFDTSFNHYKDRQRLRTIAEKAHANVLLFWLTTPLDIAKSRATDADQTHARRNHYPTVMTDETFNAIVKHLESPRADETHIELDGTDITLSQVKQVLEAHNIQLHIT